MSVDTAINTSLRSPLTPFLLCDSLRSPQLGGPKEEFFSEITPEPVAAASLGQVYRARLKDGGGEVAVKVQRPEVLETVSLDLHLVRSFGLALNKINPNSGVDVVSLLDEFGGRFYDELDYVKECDNGLRVYSDFKNAKNVKIPFPYSDLCSRRVHTAEWCEGEKLSQSSASDVGALVNLGVTVYLEMLLSSGFFHADPHPGNMLRSPEGELVILDFGLMTSVSPTARDGMVAAIVHLLRRDYSMIGDDFKDLEFIPPEVDTAPIVPALKRVFDAALSGGGAKSINFQEVSADLAEITFDYDFRLPPYFALIIRAIAVLEGIALVGNPSFAIIDEAFPWIARRLLTDGSEKTREALKFLVYGKDGEVRRRQGAKRPSLERAHLWRPRLSSSTLAPSANTVKQKFPFARRSSTETGWWTSSWRWRSTTPSPQRGTGRLSSREG